MMITLRNLFTKETVLKKHCENLTHLPRHGEAFKLSDGRIARVVDVEYTLASDKEFTYQMIDIIVEVFEKEKPTEEAK